MEVNDTQSERGRHSADPSIVILTTSGCGFCRKTKIALGTAGLEYEEVNVSKQTDVMKKAKELTGHQTVPQVFVDGRLLGGYTEITKLLDSGELQDLSRNARQPALPEVLRNLVQEPSSAPMEDLRSLVLPQGMSMERYKFLREVAGEMRGHRPRAMKESFGAEQGKEWLMGREYTGNQATAVAIMDDLLASHFIEFAASSTKTLKRRGDTELLRMVADVSHPDKKLPLNAAFRWSGRPRSASKVSEILREGLLGLFEKRQAEDGKLVQDPEFQLFVTATAELQAVDLSPLKREERIAFFINIYNVLIVHAQVVLGGPRSFLSRLRWFSSIKYLIGGLEYSADDIEHGILRENRPPPASLPVLLGHAGWSSRHFKHDDPRLKQSVDLVDKRIHFALNCGAKSCPPIKVYTPETLEEGLESATAAFCEGGVMVNIDRKVVTLSKIFKWYATDFGSKEELLAWVQGYLPSASAQNLERLLNLEGPGSVKIKYQDYDWEPNSS